MYNLGESVVSTSCVKANSNYTLVWNRSLSPLCEQCSFIPFFHKNCTNPKYPIIGHNIIF